MKTAFRRVLLSLLLIPLIPAYSQDYSLFGQIEMEGTYSGDLESQLSVEADHSLDYENFSFRMRHKLSLDEQETPEHQLNEAYISWYTIPELTITTGKQRLPWGRGTAFFPTDTLHPSHTREDVEGFTGLSAVYNPNLRVQINSAVDFSAPLEAAAGSSENSDFYTSLKYASYVSFTAGTADIALSGVYRNGETLRPGAGISLDAWGFILSSEAAVEMAGGNVYPDPTALSFNKADTPLMLVSGGIRKTHIPESLPDLSLTAACEYLYAGTGYSESERKRYVELAALGVEPDGTLPTLGRQYVFILAGVELLNSFSLELAATAGLPDYSALYSAELKLLTIPGVDLSAGAEVPTGSSDSEFGLMKALYGDYRINLGTTIYF